MQKNNKKRLSKIQDIDFSIKKPKRKQSTSSEESDDQNVQFDRFEFGVTKTSKQMNMNSFLIKEGQQQPKKEKQKQIQPTSVIITCDEISATKPIANPSIFEIDVQLSESDEYMLGERDKQEESFDQNQEWNAENNENQNKEIQSVFESNLPQEKQNLLQSFDKQDAALNAQIESTQIVIEEEKKEVQQQSTMEIEIYNDKPFLGESFFIFGEFEGFTKQDLNEVIKNLGGKIASLLFRNCNFLYGTKVITNNESKAIQDTQKYKEALKLKIKMYNLSQFGELIQEKCQRSLSELLFNLKQEQPSQQHQQQILQQPNKKQQMEMVIDQSQFFLESKSKFKLQQNEVIHLESHQQGQQSKNKHVATKKSELWTEKYAPKKVTDCFQDHVPQIINWINGWGQHKPLTQDTSSFQSYNFAAKALLLSGPPGIGKTTVIRLIAKQMNYQLIEWNASDVRSKLQIENYVKHLQDNTVLVFGGQVTEKTIILMDEVDGMSGSDKGGNKCLIDMIKMTKVPIVCICNDRSNQKIRSLANHCLDIKFQKPNAEQVLKKLLVVCKQEGVSFNESELKQHIEQCQCDFRQLLNSLQMHKMGLKTSLTSGGKDSAVTTNIFEAGKKLLNYSENAPIHKLMEYYFIDPDLMPLMYSENYLEVRSKTASIENIAKSAESIADSDVFNTKVRKQNEWALMPNVGFFATMYPTQKMKGQLHKQVAFPTQLGKISSQNKTKRQLVELKDCFAEQTHVSSVKAVKFDFLQPFAVMVYDLLSNQGSAAFENVTNLFKNYNLTMSTFQEALINCLPLFPKRDPFSELSIMKQFVKHFKEVSDSVLKMGNTKKVQKAVNERKYNEFDDNEYGEEQEVEDEEEETKKKGKQNNKKQQGEKKEVNRKKQNKKQGKKTQK